jgi:hypothetical protein
MLVGVRQATLLDEMKGAYNGKAKNDRCSNRVFDIGRIYGRIAVWTTQTPFESS